MAIVAGPFSVNQKSWDDNEMVKANRCEICDKSFCNEFNTRRHKEDVHGKIKNHRCNVCNKSFGKNCLLRQFFIFDLIQKVSRLRIHTNPNLSYS